MPSYASNRHIPICGLLTAAILLFSLPAQGQEAIDWRTSAELDKQLQRPFDLTWDSVPLRDGLHSISLTQGVAIFLDRRVDPDQEMTMAFSSEPVESGLMRIAAQTGNGMSRVGDVIYIGPESIAKRLPTVAELQAQFAKRGGVPEALKLVSQKHYHWPRLANPRDVLIDVAVAHDMEWTNLDQVVKHDLWPAVDFPAMKTTEFLTLVLAGYDASYRFDKTADGVKLQLVPIPENLSLTRVHRYEGNHRDAIAKIKELFPEATVKSDGEQSIEVIASQEVQEEVAKLLRGRTARNTTVVPGDKVFTLKIQEQPLGPIIQALAAKLGYEAQLPEGMEVELHQRISFSVEKVDMKTLLDAAFADTPFTYELDGTQLLVKKKPEVQ